MIVVAIIALFCQFLWFPAPFLQIDGTWFALLILATVDITLGPLLTLLLVSSKKSIRDLTLDMSVILVIQISALGYGLTQIEQERTYAIVHLDGVFNLVAKKEIAKLQLIAKQRLPKYQGIYYAMVVNSDLPSHTTTSKRPLLYSPERFKLISKKSMKGSQFPYQKLPADVKEQYNENYIFKLLAGKNRHGLLVFNNDLKLIDILLLPKQ
ncbi:hypothetical protein CXF71_20350 [Colwellia sp. 12G3]|nr:hypothetical protein CXF71_20350 [Colwellia sp. 12G3]